MIKSRRTSMPTKRGIKWRSSILKGLFGPIWLRLYVSICLNSGRIRDAGVLGQVEYLIDATSKR